MTSRARKKAGCYANIIACALLGIAPSVYALNDAQGFEDCRLATNEELERLRGGFEWSVGGTPWLLSLGIERITHINGALETITTLNPPGPSAALGFTPALEDFNLGSAREFRPIQLVQNGPGNTFVPIRGADFVPTVGTIIQNTLDNQVIRNITVINADLVYGQLLHAMDTASRLEQVLAGSGGR